MTKRNDDADEKQSDPIIGSIMQINDFPFDVVCNQPMGFDIRSKKEREEGKTNG